MFQRFFNDALSDSDNYYSALKAYQIEPDQNFIDVKNRIGLDAATTYAQMYFANQKVYQRFRKEIDLHPNGSNQLNSKVDVLLVLPPRGSLPIHSIQSMMRQIFGLATSAGFANVSHAQLNCDNALAAAKRLSQIVKDKKRLGREVVLVSFSYGSAITRIMLDSLRDDEIAFLKGWFNISGLLFGTPRFHCSDKFSLFSPVSRPQRSYSCEQRYFRGKPNLRGLRTVHVLGMKNGTLLLPKEVKQRQQLKAWGPNDGLVCYESYRKLEQPVIPVVDQGHYIDLSPMAVTFVKALSSMVSLLPHQQKTKGQLDGFTWE